MKFIVTAATHPDHAEGNNQDSVIARQAKTIDGKDACFSVVCDGMGDGGQSASLSVAKAFDDWFEAFKSTPGADPSEEVIFKTWDKIFTKLTRRIYSECQGEACATVAVFLILDGTWYMANIGDVRVYEVSQNGANQVSTDHTYAQREIELGHMEPVEAMMDEKAFYVLQAIGKTKDLFASKATGDVEEGNVYLVCTGGFYRKNRKSFLYGNFRPDKLEGTQESAVLEVAKENALVNGETDDISAVVIRTVADEERSS